MENTLPINQGEETAKSSKKEEEIEKAKEGEIKEVKEDGEMEKEEVRKNAVSSKDTPSRNTRSSLRRVIEETMKSPRDSNGRDLLSTPEILTKSRSARLTPSSPRFTRSPATGPILSLKDWVIGKSPRAEGNSPGIKRKGSNMKGKDPKKQRARRAESEDESSSDEEDESESETESEEEVEEEEEEEEDGESSIKDDRREVELLDKDGYTSMIAKVRNDLVSMINIQKQISNFKLEGLKKKVDNLEGEKAERSLEIQRLQQKNIALEMRIIALEGWKDTVTDKEEEQNTEEMHLTTLTKAVTECQVQVRRLEEKEKDTTITDRLKAIEESQQNNVDWGILQRRQKELEDEITKINVWIGQMKQPDKVHVEERNSTEPEKLIWQEINKNTSGIKRIAETMKEIGVLDEKVKDNVEWLKRLQERAEKTDDYSRYYNVIWQGLEHTYGESFDELYQCYRWLINELGMSPYTLIDTVHKLPSMDRNGNKDCIIKLVSQRDREMLIRRSNHPSFRRKYPNYIIKEHFCKETEEKRRILGAVCQQANIDGINADMQGDKVRIDNKVYGIEDLKDLPDKIRVQQCGAKKYSNIIAFMGKASPFSNFYPAKVRVGKTVYESNESYIQEQKAIFLGEMDKAKTISKCIYPETAKKMGNSLKGWNKEREKQWKTRAKVVAKEVNLAKFRQNKHLQKWLLNTGNDVLVEAAQGDPFWGCGFHNRVQNFLERYRKNPGDNIQGGSLMETRRIIREELRRQ